MSDAMLQLITETLNTVRSMDSKLTAHIDDETQMINKLSKEAFPGDDPAGHRKYHEDQMKIVADRAAFWHDLAKEISKWGLLGVLGFLVVAAWRAFLMGPK